MPKTLNELNWFSFPDGFKEQPDFTIWQAIAYILKTVSKNGAVLKDYIETFRKLENDMAMDLLEYYDEIKRPVMVHSDGDYKAISHDDFVNSQYDLESIALSDGDIEEDLSLLNQNRFTFIENMVLPNILCNLLLSESENSGTSPLTFKNIQDGFNINATRITKASLKKWKSLSIIGELGLADINRMKTGRRKRSDRLDNILKVMGVLMRLLSELDADIFMTVSDSMNSTSRIKIKAITNRLLDMVDNNKSNFPKESTISDILTEARNLADAEVSIKP